MSPASLNSGDTSWVLFCTAAVLFMTPGLALFYAGMVSRRNTLVMLQQNVIPLGVISLTLVLVGYSLAFGADTGNGLIADLFGEESINAIGQDGVFFGGGFGLLGEQVLALGAVIAFSFVATWLIATAIERTIGLRGAPDDEDDLDEAQQGMNAYDSDAG